MTPSQLIATWAVAAATVAAFVFGIVSMFGEPEIGSPPRTDIVAIGSSLMAHAVPISGQGDSLLGDGRSHFRIAQVGYQETEVLDVIESAIDRGTSLIFVEANHFIAGLSSTAGQRLCDGPSNSIRLFLGRQRAKVRNATKRLRGIPNVSFYDREPADLRSPHRIDPLMLRQIRGLMLLSPCDEPRLQAIVARAKARNARIVFVLIPRSPTFEAALGSDSRAITLRHAQEFAARLGVELFAPTDAWSNAEFWDQSHMNLLGRRHFLLNLRRWWMSVR